MYNENEKIDYYDDDNHDYEDFWIGRDYEHLSEVIAINKLLDNRHFKTALDYGGGYGRLANTFLKYSDELYLTDPADKQLNIGRKKLGGNKKVKFMKLESVAVIPVEYGTIDLLAMIRVSHHLVEPDITFKEINRVLNTNGYAVIEIANHTHFVNKLRYSSKLKKLPLEPTQIGQVANGKKDVTPFVNHNPKTIEKLLKKNDFEIVDKLSVSNLRNKKINKTIGMKTSLKIEGAVQKPFKNLNFGPSIFYLVKKIN